MSFRSAKSRLKIDKVGGLGRPMGAMAVIWGRVGGRGGGQQRLLESDRNWQESAESVPNALLPASARYNRNKKMKKNELGKLGKL